MKVLNNKAVVIGMLVLLLMGTAACDNTVKKAAGYLSDIADTLGEVQSVTIDAYGAGLVSEEIHDSILRSTLRANEAGKEATNILMGLEKSGVTQLDLDTKQKLMKYAIVISDSLDSDNIADLANIQDPDTRTKIKTGLATARAVLATLSALLGT